jgi:hypothetical protein
LLSTVILAAHCDDASLTQCGQGGFACGVRVSQHQLRHAAPLRSQGVVQADHPKKDPPHVDLGGLVQRLIRPLRRARFRWPGSLPACHVHNWKRILFTASHASLRVDTYAPAPMIKIRSS